MNLERALFLRAVSSSYPYAVETLELFHAYRTALWLRKFIALLQQYTPHFTKKKLNRICYLRNKTAKPHCYCYMYNLEQLFHVIQIIKEKPNSDPGYRTDVHFTDIRQFRECMAMESYSHDVYVCLFHRDYIHICRGKYCDLEVGSAGSSYCPVSHQSIQNYEVNLFNHDTIKVRGMCRDVRMGYGEISSSFSKNIYLHNDAPYPVGEDEILCEFGRVLTSAIQWNNLVSFLTSQSSRYQTYVEQEIQFFTVIPQAIPGKRRNRSTTRRKWNRRRSRRKGAFMNMTQFLKTMSRENDSFISRQKKFMELISESQHLKHQYLLTLTQIIRLVSSAVENRTVRPYRSPESIYVDTRPMIPFLPVQKGSLSLFIKNPILSYFNFLNDSDIVRMISLRKNCIFGLIDGNHPWWKNIANEKRENIRNILHYVHKLLPGLYRTIMFITIIERDSKPKHHQLLTDISHANKTDHMVNPTVHRHNLTFNHRRYHLHRYVPDTEALHLAEVLLWFRETITRHPFILHSTSFNISDEELYVGAMYLLRDGFPYEGRPLFPKIKFLEKRNFLLPENMISLLGVPRKIVNEGRTKIVEIFTNLLQFHPFSSIDYFTWKKIHGPLSDLN